MSKIFADVSANPLQISAACEFVDAPGNGALNLFVGRVRNLNDNKTVAGVSYDVFAPLACSVFRTLCEEAQERFGQALNCYVEHFQGRLDVGGISVLIAVGSPHRDESYLASRYLIEQLKVRAPVWKQEHYLDGDSEWIKGHSLCRHT